MAGIIEVKDQGKLRIYDADNSHYVDIVVPSSVTANRTITIPDASFTVPQVTNATHSGEVTGATALTIADNIVDEANLKVSNTPTNGYMLTAQSGNTGGLTWAEAAGGGVENITTFRLSTNFTMGTGADITTNWGVTGGAQLGTAISESSGIFTFPQTGYYMIESQLFLQRIQGDSDYIGIEIKATTNNSSYATIFQNYTFIPNTANIHHYVYGSSIFDVTDVSNYKVKLAYQSESATNIRVVGNTSMDRTFIRFIRLGDT